MSAAEAMRLLGLARRAGATVPGVDGARRAVAGGAARLLVVARDASATQLDKVEKLRRNRAVPQVVLGDRAALGTAIGKGPTSVIAVTNESLAGRLVALCGGVEASDMED